MNLTVGFENPNALSRLVAGVIKEQGEMTADDLKPMFPTYTRRQIHKALMNAKDRGLVQLAKRGSGGRNGGKPGIWGPPEGVDLPPLKPMRIKPPASVWDLAQPVARGVWPPRFDGGRVYISPEDNEEAT